jgi:hypothetical protein
MCLPGTNEGNLSSPIPDLCERSTFTSLTRPDRGDGKSTQIVVTNSRENNYRQTETGTLRQESPEHIHWRYAPV